jgi:hypothetical protein
MRAFKPRTRTDGYRNSLPANVTVENIAAVTLWYGVLLEKLVVALLIKEVSLFCGGNVIIPFTLPSHLALP